MTTTENKNIYYFRLILALLIMAIIALLLGGLRFNLAFRKSTQKLQESNRLREVTENRLAEVVAEKNQALTDADQERAGRLEQQQQRQVADSINHFLINDVLSLNDLNQRLRLGREGLSSLAVNPPLSQLLDQATDKLENSNDTDPSMQARLYEILGNSYRRIGQATQGIPLLEKAVDLRQSVLGDHPAKLISRASLTDCYRVAGQVDKAAQSLMLLEQAFKTMKQSPGLAPSDSLTIINCLAEGYSALGQMDRSLFFLEQSLELATGQLGSDHLTRLDSMGSLVRGYYAAGELEKALSLHQEIIKLSADKLGSDHPITQDIMANLANVFPDRSQWVEDKPLQEKTIELAIDLAASYRAAGLLDAALLMQLRIYELSKDKLGADHPSTLICLIEQADTYFAADRLEDALPRYRQTLELALLKLGPADPITLNSLNKLAKCYHATGQLLESLPMFAEKLSQSPAPTMADFNLGKLMISSDPEMAGGVKLILLLAQAKRSHGQGQQIENLTSEIYQAIGTQPGNLSEFDKNYTLGKSLNLIGEEVNLANSLNEAFTKMIRSMPDADAAEVVKNMIEAVRDNLTHPEARFLPEEARRASDYLKLVGDLADPNKFDGAHLDAMLWAAKIEAAILDLSIIAKNARPQGSALDSLAESFDRVSNALSDTIQFPDEWGKLVSEVIRDSATTIRVLELPKNAQLDKVTAGMLFRRSGSSHAAVDAQMGIKSLAFADAARASGDEAEMRRFDATAKRIAELNAARRERSSYQLPDYEIRKVTARIEAINDLIRRTSTSQAQRRELQASAERARRAYQRHVQRAIR